MTGSKNPAISNPQQNSEVLIIKNGFISHGNSVVSSRILYLMFRTVVLAYSTYKYVQYVRVLYLVYVAGNTIRPLWSSTPTSSAQETDLLTKSTNKQDRVDVVIK